MNAAVDDMRLTGILLHNEPMARHTSWRVGGPADTWFRPASLEGLAGFLKSLPEATPVHFVGLGSNLLIRDGGVRGAVIAAGGFMRTLERVNESVVRAGASLPCATFARRCVRFRLGPAAFFAGIPGTIGGALAMNAGAFGGETWERVRSVETIDRAGDVRKRDRSEYQIAYRSVEGPKGEWFIAATFELSPDAGTDMGALKAMMAQRSASQPVGRPSCGSVFRNPPGGHAGALIERAGMKGARVGGAQVSDKHANFIINEGDATASDIEQLIDKIRAAVRADSGIELELEVRILGEPAEGGA
jgi:UDP-N-acetylmuramate dehydrogenase